MNIPYLNYINKFLGFFILTITLIFLSFSCKETQEFSPYNYGLSVKIEDKLESEEEKKDRITLGFAVPLSGGLKELSTPIFNGAVLALQEVNLLPSETEEKSIINTNEEDRKEDSEQEPEGESANNNQDEENKENSPNKEELEAEKLFGYLEAEKLFGYPVNIVIEDTFTNSEHGKMVAEKFAFLDNVIAIIGAYSSDVTIAMSDVTKRSNTVMISPTSSSPRITNLIDSDTVFRTVPSDDLQGKFLAKIAREDKAYDYVAVMHQDNAYGNGLANSFKEEFKKREGITNLFPYDPNKAEFNSEINEVNATLEYYDLSKDTYNTAVLIIGYPTDVKTILSQFSDKSIKPDFFFSDGVQSPEVFEEQNKLFVEGSWGTGFATYDSPYLDTFKNKYKAQFGNNPVAFSLNMYDATAIILLALSGADNPLDKNQVKRAVRYVTNAPGEKINAGELKKGIALLKENKDIDYVGLGGNHEFDEHGDINYIFSIWEVRDSKIITVDTRKASS
ncbi:MAG: ABC transporter substrate-binding protein [Spirochaetota bacterium]